MTNTVLSRARRPRAGAGLLFLGTLVPFAAAQEVAGTSRLGGAAAPAVGLPTPCDARVPIDALPCTIAAPGSYYLTASATGVAGEHGIVVTADDVAIDLNGHTLIGVGGSLNGIDAGGAARVSVRNGRLVRWGGAGAVLGPGARVVDVGALGSGAAGLVLGEGGLVERCVAADGALGIELGAGGRARHCLAVDNAGAGIRTLGTDGVVEACVVSDNGTDGVERAGAVGWTVRDSAIGFNQRHGVSVEAGTVRGNNLTRNGTLFSDRAVDVVGAIPTRVEANLMAGSGRGVRISQTAGHVVARNVFHTVATPVSGGSSFDQIGPIGTAASATHPWSNVRD